jgi:hypothetical protein
MRYQRQTAETVFKEKHMGSYAGVYYNAPYLIVNSVVMQLSTPHYKEEKGGVGKISPIG